MIDLLPPVITGNTTEEKLDSLIDYVGQMQDTVSRKFENIDLTDLNYDFAVQHNQSSTELDELKKKQEEQSTSITNIENTVENITLGNIDIPLLASGFEFMGHRNAKVVNPMSGGSALSTCYTTGYCQWYRAELSNDKFYVKDTPWNVTNPHINIFEGVFSPKSTVSVNTPRIIGDYTFLTDTTHDTVWADAKTIINNLQNACGISTTWPSDWMYTDCPVIDNVTYRGAVFKFDTSYLTENGTEFYILKTDYNEDTNIYLNSKATKGYVVGKHIAASVDASKYSGYRYHQNFLKVDFEYTANTSWQHYVNFQLKASTLSTLMDTDDLFLNSAGYGDITKAFDIDDFWDYVPNCSFKIIALDGITDDTIIEEAKKRFSKPTEYY